MRLAETDGSPHDRALPSAAIEPAPMPRFPTGLLALVLSLAPVPIACAATDPGADRALARELLAELVAADTTNEHGGTTAIAESLAKRFREAEFASGDVHVEGASERNRNLVVRLRGAGERPPLLLLAHLDVVEARREDWSLDPFTLTERDGHFYGRGTEDIKGGAANLVATLLRLKRERVVPRGDLILALTAGEESGVDNGVEWLLANRRALIEAPLCFNQDGGGGELRAGRRTAMNVQTAEKVYITFGLRVRNAGGHSSQPRPDNAIHRLARALVRIETLAFPARTSDTTRGYLAANAAREQGELAMLMAEAAKPGAEAETLDRLAAQSPLLNAQLRTTCTPTLIAGGHAENALPQLATASVNCRMLPDERADAVERALRDAIADPEVELSRLSDAKPSPASPVDARVMSAIARALEPVYGKLPVVPYMDTGASDGLYLRGAGIPVYAFGSFFLDVNDVRAHGRDERIPVREFYDGLEFSFRLLRDW